MQFKEIIGQRNLINRLTRIIDSGKVSHAQLFVGDMGYGTLSIALAYIQYLNCKNRRHYEVNDPATELIADSCGECPSCKKINAMVHSDLHIIFPNTTTKKVDRNPSSSDFQNDFREYVTQNGGYCSFNGWFKHIGAESKQGIINVRDGNDLIRSLSLKTYESEYKSAIVWLPEKMNVVTANKLLKTIEEPYGNTLIILVAEEQDRLLPTILSRTQHINIRRIDTPSMAQRLADEHPDIPASTIADIANAAEGNYLAANDFLNQTEQQKLFAQIFVDWMRKLFKLDIGNLAKTVDTLGDMGLEQQRQFLNYALDVFRACFLKNLTGTPSPYTLSFNDQKFTDSFPKMITVNNIESIENAINESLFNISRNAYDKIIFMTLSFAISKSLKNR